MKVRVSKVKSWKALPVQKCTQCIERCTQIVAIPEGLLTDKKFPLCNKHFQQWLDNELELAIGKEE